MFLEVTLEEILRGCVKQRRVTRTVIELNGELGSEQLIASINVLPGAHEGSRIRFPNYGDEKVGFRPADVVFILRLKPHIHFNRQGDDIVRVEMISWNELKGGYQMQRLIPTLEKETLTVWVHRNNFKITNEHPKMITAMKVFHQRGLPRYGNPTQRGNLVVNFMMTDFKEDGFFDICQIM